MSSIARPRTSAQRLATVGRAGEVVMRDDLVPPKRDCELRQERVRHAIRGVQSERIEAALIRWQIPRAEQPIHEVEEASVIRLATGRSGRMMRAVMPGRVQNDVPEPTLETGVRMIEQPGDA